MSYTDAATVGSDPTRTIRFPPYDDAGHMVAMTQAADFRADVAQFMIDSGL